MQPLMHDQPQPAGDKVENNSAEYWASEFRVASYSQILTAG
jgi:hypothetical protein